MATKSTMVVNPKKRKVDKQLQRFNDVNSQVTFASDGQKFFHEKRKYESHTNKWATGVQRCNCLCSECGWK